MSSINFGLIGASGYIAPRHMRAIKDTGNELIAALDPYDGIGIMDSYFPQAYFFTEYERFDRFVDKWRRNGNKKIEYILIQPVDEHDMKLLDNEVKYISENTNKNFSLAAFKINDWNSELTPWEMPLLRGKGNFGNGADKTLKFIKEKLIPSLVEFMDIQDKNVKYILGGYSLAGLFSLWSGYETNTFYGVAGVSPSVWYEGWIDFVRNAELKASNVYLSLGKLEETSKHKILAKIGDNIREYSEILKNSGIEKSILEWNEGNHFNDSDIRTGKGFVWILENC